MAGKCSRKGHNQKDTSSPEAIRPIRMASRPVRPPHPLGGVPARRSPRPRLLTSQHLALRARTHKRKCFGTQACQSRETRDLFVATAPSCSSAIGRLLNHNLLLEFFEKKMVGASRFERPTSCSQGRRANQAALRPDTLFFRSFRYDR